MPSKTTIDYIFKGIPRDLWKKAQEKAGAQRPPISMKWVLLQLLEGWIAGKAPTNRISDPPAKTEGNARIKPRVVGQSPVDKKQAKSLTNQTAAPRMSEGVDLGNSF